MTSKVTAANFGLSSAERNDLRELIQASRRSIVKKSENPSWKREIGKLREKNTQLAQLVIDLDQRVNLLYEIIRLSQARNEMLSQRVEALSEKETAAGGGS